MKIKSVIHVIVLVSLLGCCLLNGSRVPAANPNFSQTVLLSPHDGQLLFGMYFSDNSVFTKQPHFRHSQNTYWTPTSADVLQVQDALWKYEALDADVLYKQFWFGPCAIILTTDIRRYAGVTVNGEKHILIVGSTAPGDSGAFLAGNLSNGQQNRFPAFTDGGSAFYAVYAPASRRIEYLLFDRLVEKKTAMFTL